MLIVENFQMNLQPFILMFSINLDYNQFSGNFVCNLYFYRYKIVKRDDDQGK